jgi:hypothetical protein
MYKTVFYCPSCKRLDTQFDKKGHRILMNNPRDGWGKPMYYIECPYCHFVLSEYMNDVSKSELDYVKSLIEAYATSQENGGFLKDVNSFIKCLEMSSKDAKITLITP